MANWSGGILTAAGQALQAKGEAGTKRELTKIKLGDGAENISDVGGLTDLVSPQAVLGISSVTAKDKLCTVTGIILTSNVATGFYAREWGIFAKDGDRDILYMIAIDPNPDYVPSSDAALKVSATYAMNIAVSNAANIACTIDPSGLINAEMLAQAAGLVQRNTAYEQGDIRYDPQLFRHDWYLECETAGTTGSAILDLSNATLGSKVTDGTVVWIIKRIATQDEIYFELDDQGDIMPKLAQ